MARTRRTRAVLTFALAAGGTFAIVAVAYEYRWRPRAAAPGVEQPEEEPRQRTRSRLRMKRPRTKPEPKAEPKPAPRAKPAKPKGPRIQMPTAATIRAHRLPAGVTPEGLQSAFSRNHDPIERCLKKSVKAGETFAGTIYLQVTIDPWGKISESHIKNPELDYTSLGSCILARVGGGGYPSSPDKPITVGFPIRVIRDD